MTTKNYHKLLLQISRKPAKRNRFVKHSKPKDIKFGTGSRKCRRCGRFGAHINRYGLHLCRQCFKEVALELGFRKYGHEV